MILAYYPKSDIVIDMTGEKYWSYGIDHESKILAEALQWEDVYVGF